MTDMVCLVRDQIGDTFEGSPLSAASKLLWLLRQGPFVIFDRQARGYLGTPESAYLEYVECWEDHNRLMRDPIRTARRALPPMWLYLSMAHSLTVREAEETVNWEWFARRMHDINLWEAGRGT